MSRSEIGGRNGGGGGGEEEEEEKGGGVVGSVGWAEEEFDAETLARKENRWCTTFVRSLCGAGCTRAVAVAIAVAVLCCAVLCCVWVVTATSSISNVESVTGVS
ncbi:hypothetical protein HZH68_014135 [Vespula germanica]|uniref:Uncharacterized protein n=1 Tax=Vespula germanica TaxID=30212 RepID=A0A834J9P5_VESGE|nr:hypothetical protein HZH68_014135 [Vespula germanica]